MSKLIEQISQDPVAAQLGSDAQRAQIEVSRQRIAAAGVGLDQLKLVPASSDKPSGKAVRLGIQRLIRDNKIPGYRR